jgi:FMN-dependent oxidoreductase (nitrilotriacetate monooxygenase family)
MSRDRQLHLGAFMRPVGIHTAWWRYPGGYPDANFNFAHLAHFARRLEAAKFDAFFMADHLAVMNMPMAALRRSATVTSFDPLTLLPALAVLTERIGLIATASTTYNEPYHVARKFASLDHISNGRAGWNLVTSGNPDEALNFGRDAHVDHATRYARAREFFDVVTGLWDSFADDAFPMDPESGLFVDPAKIHVLDHRGEFLKVKGPLNVARPVQGWPVIVQAGASEAGKQIAAETAEMVFGSGSTLEAARAFYADVKGRMPAAGRDPDSLKILPGCFVVLGDTEAEAQAKKARLDDLVHPDSGLANLSVRLGVDATGFDLDAPLPDLPETNASKSGQAQIVDYARRTGATVRELARRVGGYGGLQMVGTAAQVADRMEEWLETRACDGFNVMFPFVPEGLDDVVDRLVPELQRRGLFRTAYSGTTLRDHLGLKRPANRYFAG